MPIFIDLMYPGNKNRKTRLEELSSDCGTYLANANNDYDKISAAIKNTNKIIKNAYEKIGQKAPEMKSINVMSNVEIEISELVSGIIALPIASCAFKWAVCTYLKRAGIITAEELAEVGANQLIKLNISKFLRIGGEIGAAIVVTVALEALIDSIDGAVQRKELQDGIHELITTRAKMKRIEMINLEILVSCQSVVNTYNTMEALGIYTKEMLDQAAKILVDTNMQKIGKITKEAVIKELASVDKERKSWTEEDDSSKIDWDNIVNTGKMSEEYGDIIKEILEMEKDSDLSDVNSIAEKRADKVLKYMTHNII